MPEILVHIVEGRSVESKKALMRDIHVGAGDKDRGAAAGTVESTTVVFTAHHAVLLRTMALEGRGLAWLPVSLIADDLRGARLVDAGAGGWQVPVEIRLYRQPAEMSTAAEALWNLT